MATEIVKTRQKPEPAPIASHGGGLTPFSHFPFHISRLRDEFDELLDRIALQWTSLSEGSGWRWGMEVRDEDDAVVVQAEAPGFEAGDFDVHVSDNRLVLRASKQVETKDEKGKMRESRQQTCYEAVTLPPGIDKNKVEAKYHHGVLTVTLPRTAEGKAKRITVRSS